MMHVYACRDKALHQVHAELSESLPDGTVWIDMIEPTKDEERSVERNLAIDIPTREEMREIEASSRIYHENDALYMSLNVIARASTGNPETSSITFILIHGKLVTVRYADPLPFRTFLAHSLHQSGLCETGAAVCVGLIEAIVDRVADILEGVGGEVDKLSQEVFGAPGGSPDTRVLQRVLAQIGRNGDLASRARDSLTTITRVGAYLSQAAKAHGNAELTERSNTLVQDIASINDYLNFLANKVTFLLDATLGMISIEQNLIVKIFTVFMVVFTPPTLVASIYGMNFKLMPELDWHWGYPVALVLMLLSGILPYAWFKRRGWL
jgi:magnesium transporter